MKRQHVVFVDTKSVWQTRDVRCHLLVFDHLSDSNGAGFWCHPIKKTCYLSILDLLTFFGCTVQTACLFVQLLRGQALHEIYLKIIYWQTARFLTLSVRPFFTLWTPACIPTDRLTSWGVLYHPCTVPVQYIGCYLSNNKPVLSYLLLCLLLQHYLWFREKLYLHDQALLAGLVRPHDQQVPGLAAVA